MTKLSTQHPLDLFLTHVEIRDSPAIRCSSNQDVETQYVKQKNRSAKARDHITAYVFGRTKDKNESYCVEVPYAPVCYMRVPAQFEKMSGVVPQILRQVLTCVMGCDQYAKPFAGCLHGELVRLRHAFGYRPEPDYLFLKISCSSREIYSRIQRKFGSQNTFRNAKSEDMYQKFMTHANLTRWRVKRHELNTWYGKEWFVCHEFLDDVPGFLKSIRMNINGWVRVVTGDLMHHPARRFSNATHEVKCLVTGSVVGVDLDDIPADTLGHYVKMCFDIEAVPDDMKSFPKASKALDRCTQIGTRVGSILEPDKLQDVTFTLGNPSPTTKTEIRRFDDETELFNAFAQHVVDHDVDVYTHFNGQGFDWVYLYDRACLASFLQSQQNYRSAFATWKWLRTQRDKYMPYYKAYEELRRDFKKKEEQATKEFKQAERRLFTKMAEILGTHKTWRLPKQTPAKVAVWNVESEAELKKAWDYFRPQPSIQPFFFMHRFRCTKIGFEVRAKCSDALGSQLLRHTLDGRTNMDLYLYIKTGPYGLDQFSLNHCAETFLDNVSKDDLLDHYLKDPSVLELKHQTSTENAYRMLSEYVMSKNPQLEKVVCEYCIQDVVVTDELETKLGVLMELISMMKRYRVIPFHLTQRAQQFRFVTNVSFEILDRFVFNSYDRTAKAPTYQGAAVLDPKWGLHGGPHQWIFCLDFASLYPTIMREHNLCCSTYILKCDLARILKLVLEKKHPPLLVVPYTKTYTSNEAYVGKVTSTTPELNTAYFAIKSKEDTILPIFLERNGEDRSKVKKQMKKVKAKLMGYKLVAKSDLAYDVMEVKFQTELQTLNARLPRVQELKVRKNVEKRIKQLTAGLGCMDVRRDNLPQQIRVLKFTYVRLDAEQKAIKIGLNSVYGSMGVSNGTITGLQEIAMSITYFGRTYIYKTREFAHKYAKEHPDWKDLDLEVIYGGESFFLFFRCFYVCFLILIFVFCVF